MNELKKNMFALSLLSSLVTIISLIIKEIEIANEHIETIKEMDFNPDKYFLFIDLIILILIIEQVAAYQDIKENMVSDIIHYICFLLCGICFLISALNKNPGIEFYKNQMDLMWLLPIIFVLATIKLRGLSDTFLMFVFILMGFIIGQDAIEVLIIFTLGHLFGIVIRIIQLIRKKKYGIAFIPVLIFGYEFYILLKYHFWGIIILIFLMIAYSILAAKEI